MKLATLLYDGAAVTFRDDGWFNATQAAARFDRRVDKWLKAKDTNDYINALCEITHTPKRGYLKTSKAPLANGGGTWLHPKLAIHFARWLDPRFAIWCDAQIDNLIRGKDDWRTKRHAVASTSKTMSAVLDEVRKQIGKATAAHHHMNEHKLINSLLTGEYKGLARESLSVYELDFLAHFEVRNAVLLGIGMPYEQRKGALKAEAMDWRVSHGPARLIEVVATQEPANV